MKIYTLNLEEIKKFSNSIHIKKDVYISTRNLSKNYSSHYLGKIGEYIFAQEYRGHPNLNIQVQGDGHSDFTIEGKSIDIKTCTYWKDPILKEFINIKKIPDIYVLISIKEINEKENTIEAEINGACTGTYLTNKDPENLGNLGKRYQVRKKELKELKELLAEITFSNLPIYF